MGTGSSKSATVATELDKKNAELAAMQAKLKLLEAKEQAAKEAAEADFVTAQVVPATSQALLGSALGGAAGYSLKVIGRAAAFTIGTGFIALQSLSYLGYVQVDWRKVERDATAKLDRDGDGELTINGMRRVIGRRHMPPLSPLLPPPPLLMTSAAASEPRWRAAAVRRGTPCGWRAPDCAATRVDVRPADLQEVWKDTQEVLAFNLPAGAGFTAGL